MNAPLVSIIIPTYNRAHLIGETLDSVIAQTYQNSECIVVDDGSTDHTEKVMAEYMAKDSRIRFYHRPPEHKPGGNGARNYGFKLSKGEYVNFLDSDDLFYSQTIEIKVSLGVKNNSDIVISKNCRFLEELNPTVTSIDVFTSDSFDIEFILSRNSILMGEPLIMRKAMNSIKFDEHLVRSQDFDFLLRLFRQNLNFCRIDAVLYYYRKNPNSIARRASLGRAKESRTQLNMIKRNLIYYKGNKLIEKESKRTIRKMYKALMKKRRIDRIIENFNFYRKGFNLSVFEFTFYFLMNITTQKGYDRMRRKVL